MKTLRIGKERSNQRVYKMKKLRVVMAAILLFALLVGIGNAAVLAPPVNQNLGFADTQMPNVSVDHTQPGSTAYACKDCHPGAPDIHHYMVSGGPGSNMVKTTTLGCVDCHPISGGQLTISRNCHDCHDGTAWTVNPNINLSIIRGAPGRPHHNTTKNSASNDAVKAAYVAASRQCVTCHGDGYLDNYNDTHTIPSYDASMVTPLADFKINSTIGNGREYGGCAACHDTGTEGTIFVNNNHDTHHYETTSMLGRQCNYCHVASGTRAEPIPDFSSDPNANVLRVWLNESYPNYQSMFQWDTSMRHIELRNNTIMTTNNDPINGTGCEKCHSVRDLHNIETASPGLSIAETLAAEVPGYGHIANNSDCNGCHQGWAGSVENPFPGPKAMQIDSVSPGIITADVATDVTITGDGFVEDPYTATVLVDGTPVTASIADTVIVANLNLAAGVHSIVVQKDVATTSLTSVIAVKPGTISSARLTGTTLTIDGAGLGAEQTMVVIVKSDGTRLASDSITSSSDTQIVAEASQAAVGDTVEVVTPTGLATKVIEAAEVLDSVTVTFPNDAGISWKRGTSKTVTWDRAGLHQAANVKIELVSPTKGTKVLKSSTANDGSQSVSISSKQATSSDYKIRITSLSHDPTYSDESDNTFTVTR